MRKKNEGKKSIEIRDVVERDKSGMKYEGDAPISTHNLDALKEQEKARQYRELNIFQKAIWNIKKLFRR